jgi:predicted transcriptional regulator of viral defense system
VCFVSRNITELGPKEAEFLSRLAGEGQTVFTAEEARGYWGNGAYANNVLGRLESKGWLRRLERGTYLIVPLEAGPTREWTESALVIASHLIQPAAIAYWSALHYWNMTELIPHTVFVQSTRRKHRSRKDVLGIPFRFVKVVKSKFFGVVRRSVAGQPIFVTDREKTLLDAADRPELTGGIAQLAQGLRTSWSEVNWQQVDEYLARCGVGSLTKRLGYLVETLNLPIPQYQERLETWRQSLSSGISLLEPGHDTGGPIVTRWRLRVNVEETWQPRGSGDDRRG